MPILVALSSFYVARSSSLRGLELEDQHSSEEQASAADLPPPHPAIILLIVRRTVVRRTRRRRHRPDAHSPRGGTVRVAGATAVAAATAATRVVVSGVNCSTKE